MAAGRSSQGDGGGTVPRQEAQELHNFGAEPAANFRANDLFFFSLFPSRIAHSNTAQNKHPRLYTPASLHHPILAAKMRGGVELKWPRAGRFYDYVGILS